MTHLRITTRPSMCSLLLLAALALPAHAQTIRNIGFLPGGLSTTAAALSGDGSTVVGSADKLGNTHAFKWTAAGGIVDLGLLPGNFDASASDVNRDGSIIVGKSGFSGVRWVAGQIGAMQQWRVGFDQYAFDLSCVSADGAVVYGNLVCAGVGGGGLFCGVAGFPFRSTAVGQRQPLVANATPPFLGLDLLRSIATDAQGNVVVGWGPAFGTNISGVRGFRWTAATGLQEIGILPGFLPASSAQSSTVPMAISADGSTIVGECYGAPASGNFVKRAFRWNQGVMTDLGTLPGPYNSVTANDVNASGSVIVGMISNFDNFEQQAVLWTPALGLVNLNTYLPTQGVNLSGWSLESATAISDDGRVIAGTGSFGGEGLRSWVVTLPQCLTLSTVSDASACAGSEATLTVTPTGTGPFSFQWRKNTVPLNAAINPSAATASLSIAAAQAADEGTYDCVVSNACGSVQSTAALLTVRANCCDSIDFNNNTLFPEDSDLVDFLSVLAGGPCSTNTCSDIDFNNDGLFPSDDDLVAFLRVLAGGVC